MPTSPRYTIIDNQSIFHVTWQCHNKDWLFKDDWTKQLYYNLLLRFRDRYKIIIYSYCFMSSHPHLTGYCEDRKLFSDFFRIVNSLFARKYNQKMRRRGQVVMDRFKSPRIESDEVLEKVMFYIDLNPKRARIVEHPKKYRWGSFHYYAYGKNDELITPAPSYLEMGRTEKDRQKTYLCMVEEILKNDWKEKKPYASTPFIGNPDWVKQKTKELTRQRREKLKSWKERFRDKFLNSS